MRAALFLLITPLVGGGWLSAIEAADPRGFNSDAELRQALIGTWQIEEPIKESFPITKGFVHYRADGRFDQSSIAEFGGERSRIDFHGTWRAENGALLETAAEPRDSSLVGTTQRSAITAVTADRITIRGKSYSFYLRRAPWPTALPPVSGLLKQMVESGRLKRAYAIETPQPWYPYLARKNRMEGRGIFRLWVNPDGNVRTVEIVRSTRDRALDTAAVNALQRWRFKAGKVKTLVLPVTFVMRGA